MSAYDNLTVDSAEALANAAGALPSYAADGTAIDGKQLRDQMAVLLEGGRIQFNLGDFTEEDGTALAIWADGANPQAGYAVQTTTETTGLRWNNHANPDPVTTSFIVPKDMDVTQACTLYFLASKVGATVGDAVTWTVLIYSVGDGDLHDADASFGGASSAMTGNSTSKTLQLESLALAADSMSQDDVVTFSVGPTDGTLGTDDVILHAVYLDYVKRSGA